VAETGSSKICVSAYLLIQ